MRTNSSKLWVGLIFFSGAPRILAAFFLPNAFGDAYVYIRDIGVMSTKLSSHTFAWNDLFGFWLPLYQFSCAVINVFVGNGFYVGKVVSAISGVGVCLLVYSVTLQLTRNRTAALAGFILIAFNPLHIFNSGSAMTDVPHAFFVLAALYFVLRGKWIPAAILSALAGLTRVDSWMLIALIPALQLLRERRISILAVMILLVPPTFWFYISWKATGNWLACFQARQQYHDWLIAVNPVLGRFILTQVLRDAATLLVSADIAVMASVLFATWIVFRRPLALLTGRTRSRQKVSAIAVLLFFSAFLGLLLLAYLTHQQPIIFPRYGLILFALGIPILCWMVSKLRMIKPQLGKQIMISMIVICVFDATIEAAAVIGDLNQYAAQRATADYLRDHFHQDTRRRIFSDEETVRALSGIAPEKFLSSLDAPREREQFLDFLMRENVQYVVVVNKKDSIAAKVFSSQCDERRPISGFGSVMQAHSNFLPMKICVYEKSEK